MRLAYINVCGFRGYRRPVRIDLGSAFTVIDGRNGVGKSTICDAVEFALTGTISKYPVSSAAGETVRDYLWWRGTPRAEDYFVDVGFVSGDTTIAVIRRRGEEGAQGLDQLRDLLCDAASQPERPLEQLCRSTIIRDELIAALSLDMKEGDRFQFLRDALGALNADEEIKRASKLKNACETRRREAQQAVEQAQAELTRAATRIDEARAALSSDAAVNDAHSRLKNLLGVEAELEEMGATARDAIAGRRMRIEKLTSLFRSWVQATQTQTRLVEIEHKAGSLRDRLAALEKQIAEIEPERERFDATQVAEGAKNVARWLTDLAALGERLGVIENRCPLCAAERSDEEFAAGLFEARRRARELDGAAAEAARQFHEINEKINALKSEFQQHALNLESLEKQALECHKLLSDADALLSELSLPNSASAVDVEERLAFDRQVVVEAEQALSVIETLSFNTLLLKSQRDHEEAKRLVEHAEARLARARRAEGHARVIHDAARRAAGETLDRRLERIGPVLGELYRRLRPHTIWRDIDYMVRGDVRRFLRLEVGDSLNPQFLFSSGQRRVTGLAFLLSIYMSTSWMRLKSIILDDPVQHIDDFRAVHLAEVLALLRAQGHQVICAVEDEALADLICRRLATSTMSGGFRFTLGEKEDGVLDVISMRTVQPLPQSVLSQSSPLASQA